MILIAPFFPALANANCAALFQDFAAKQTVGAKNNDDQIRDALLFLREDVQIENLSDPIDRVVLRFMGSEPDQRVGSMLSDVGLKAMQRALELREAEKQKTVRDLSNGQIFTWEDLGVFSDPVYFDVAKRFSEARDAKNWAEAIRIYDTAPDVIQENSTMKIQAAMAINRQAAKGDPQLRYRAESLIWEAVAANENITEAMGVLARVYRDMYEHAVSSGAGPATLEARLKKLVDTLEMGFFYNPGDFYPGMNLLDAYLVQAKQGKKYRDIVDVKFDKAFDLVRSAIFQTEGKPDHWTWAGRLTVAIVEGYRDRAFEAMEACIETAKFDWMIETDIGSLRRTTDNAEAVMKLFHGATLRNFDVNLAREILGKLDDARERKFGMDEFADKPFGDTEGAIHHGKPKMRKWVNASGIKEDLESLGANRPRIMSVQEFVRESQTKSQPEGYLLGVTGLYVRTMKAFAKLTSKTGWWDAFDRFGIEKKPENSAQMMKRIQDEGAQMYVVIPPNFSTLHRGSHSWHEYQWLMADPARMKNVTFVFGAHDLLNMTFTEQVTMNRGWRQGIDILVYLLEKYRMWLQHHVDPERLHEASIYPWRDD